MSVQIDLTGDVALVTGGGSGIGEAIALTLAEAGSAVAVGDLNAEAAARVAESITAKGGRAAAVTMDIADPAAVSAGFDTIHDQLGQVSTLVNCAAMWVIKPFAETSDAEQQKVVDVTLNGTMTVTRAALPDLAATRGQIVTVVSDGAKVGERGLAVYAAAKAGLLGMIKSVAQEHGREGIRSNGIAPGTTVTPGSAGFVDAIGADKLAKAYPLRRLGEPQDIANAVLFLASPLSSWVTGQVLSVSGGFSMV